MPLTFTFDASEKISPTVNINPFKKNCFYTKKLTPSTHSLSRGQQCSKKQNVKSFQSELSLTDNDDSQDIRVGERIIFIALYFYPPTKIQTFICDFASKTTTSH